MRVPQSDSTSAPTRVRLSFGSVELHTSHVHPRQQSRDQQQQLRQQSREQQQHPRQHQP